MKSELIILHCLETNCFCNVEASKMLCGFNTEWLVAYTNPGFQFSENNPIFIITFLKRKRLRSIGGIAFHPVKFSTQMARDREHQHKKRMSSCLFMQMSDI